MPIDPAILYISNVINNPKKWVIEADTGEQSLTIAKIKASSEKISEKQSLTAAEIKASNEKISEFPRNDSKTYSNIKWFDNIGRNDTTNPNLLEDINTAAKQAGVIVTITTTKSDHDKFVKNTNVVSNHYNNIAVDIAIVNGRSVKGNNGDANKVVAILEKMGYARNVENNNSKAVLWLTAGHYNHFHVSNKIR